MTITALPVLNRTDATFKADVDTFFGTELPQFSVEAEAARVEINANTVTASAAAVTAAADALAAALAATAAAATANAVRWVSGTTYALDVCAISPANSQTYRRKVAGAGTTDPSLDATNWVKAVDALPVQTGNAGKFLTTNGTAESWGAVPASGLTLLATLTPTVAANIDFLTTFSDAYDNYLIIGNGITVAADDSLRMRVAVSGSADSGSNYFGVTSAANSPLTASDTSHTVSNTITMAGRGASFEIRILNANDATQSKVLHSIGTSQSAATPAFHNYYRDGVFIANNAISGVRLYLDNGANFAATGSIRVYGYAK